MSAFIPATAFEGPKEGHVFKMGGEGLGYYQDLGTIDVPAPPPAEEQRPFTLGQRVVSEDGYFATVRYVGPVKSAKKADATFVGVVRYLGWRQWFLRARIVCQSFPLDAPISLTVASYSIGVGRARARQA